ncbi:MAG TPA: D-2-hydroxyacid dehydrogenase [Actinomycetota bacterium]|nr:D-2-hydroxyacid dehydrogenase [Actinomycetota bacterium]
MSDGVSERGRVVVMGASADTAPPGVSIVAEVVELAFADSREELTATLPGADVLFAWRPRSGLLEPAWEQAGDLRWIQSASAGVEDLLFPGLVESEVVLTNARGVFDDAMAEYVAGLLLLMAKGLPRVLERQARREWRHHDAEMLAGRKVLVVGVGSIGRAVGRTLRNLGMTVRGVGTTARGGDDVFRAIQGIDELADACAWADVVVNVLPATAATMHAFDAAIFHAMGPTTRFVNVGRGSTVDEEALVDALREGRIAAAALDVFQREPLPSESPLWGLPNVIVSPHMSADFAAWREALVELFVENLERYLTGRPLKNVVDKRRGYVPS